jgi:hypothetical protein
MGARRLSATLFQTKRRPSKVKLSDSDDDSDNDDHRLSNRTSNDNSKSKINGSHDNNDGTQPLDDDIEPGGAPPLRSSSSKTMESKRSSSKAINSGNNGTRKRRRTNGNSSNKGDSISNTFVSSYEPSHVKSSLIIWCVCRLLAIG